MLCYTLQVSSYQMHEHISQVNTQLYKTQLVYPGAETGFTNNSCPRSDNVCGGGEELLYD